MASEIVSPCVVRGGLNKIGSRLPKQFYRTTGEESGPKDLTAGEDRFVVFKNTSPNKKRVNASGSLIEKKCKEPLIQTDLTMDEDRFVVFKNTSPIKKRVNKSGLLIEQLFKEPSIQTDLILSEDRSVVFKKTKPSERKTVDDESSKSKRKTSVSLIDKVSTEPLIRKEIKNDRIKNIDESSEMSCRTSQTKPRNAIRSKIEGDKHMTLGRRMPLLLHEKQVLGPQSQLNEKCNITHPKDIEDRHVIKVMHKVGRHTRLPNKTLEEPRDEPRSESHVIQKKRLPVVNAQVAVPKSSNRNKFLSSLTKTMLMGNNVGRSHSSDVAPIQTNLGSTKRKPYEEEIQIVFESKENEASNRHRKGLSKLPSIVMPKTKVSLTEGSNEAPISKDLSINDEGTVRVKKCQESQNEHVPVKKSKVKGFKSKRSNSSTMSDPGSKWDIDNKKRQTEFSDKIFRWSSRCLGRKKSGDSRTRHVSCGDLDSPNIRTDIVENKHSKASPKKRSHSKKRSASDSKRSRPKPILRKSSSSEEKTSEDDEPQIELSCAPQKCNRVTFDLRGSETPSLIKKSKKTDNFLKNEINALKLMSSVIVEEDSDFPGDVSSKSSGGEKRVVNARSDSEHPKKIDSLGDKSFEKDELETVNHELDVKVDVRKNEQNVSVETSSRPELDAREQHDRGENRDPKHKASRMRVSEMGAYMLKEKIEAEYHRKSIALNGMILKLKGEQHQVMESYSKVTEEYDGLKRQGYDVTPVEDLLLVALDNIKDYLIAGQLANTRSTGDCDKKLSEDVSYTICVPSEEVLQGDAFLKDFRRKLRHFTARSYDTATCITQKLNGIITKFKSGSLHKKNSGDVAKEGEASVVLCEQLQFELGNYTYEIMRDVKGLLKQNQLLSQLEQQVARKLDDVLPQKNEERKLEIEKLVEENRKLRKELKVSNNEVKTLKAREKQNDQSGYQMKMTIQETLPLRDNITIQETLPHSDNMPTANTIKSDLEQNQEMTNKNGVPDEGKKTSSTNLKESFGVGAMELIERYQERCCKLEEAVALAHQEKKALEKKLLKKINGVSAELTAMTQKLLVETELRGDFEKDLEEKERFISDRESAMCRLIKLNDPSCRHPYPRLDMAPSEREKMTWVELQRARSLLKQTRNEVLKVTAERDECLSTVSRFLGTKTRTGDHSDPANRLVIVEERLVRKMRGELAALTAEAEKRKVAREKQKKEAKKLRFVLDGLNCGADAESVMNDNYDLKKQVEEMRSCQQDLSARNEQLDAMLCAKMFENAQRDRVMVEQCAAYETHEQLVALMNDRHGGMGKSINFTSIDVTSNATRIASLLSAIGSNIYNMVRGRRGNPDP